LINGHEWLRREGPPGVFIPKILFSFTQQVLSPPIPFIDFLSKGHKHLDLQRVSQHFIYGQSLRGSASDEVRASLGSLNHWVTLTGCMKVRLDSNWTESVNKHLLIYSLVYEILFVS